MPPAMCNTLMLDTRHMYQLPSFYEPYVQLPLHTIQTSTMVLMFNPAIHKAMATGSNYELRSVLFTLNGFYKLAKYGLLKVWKVVYSGT